MLCKFDGRTELWPLIDVIISFPLNILRTKWIEFHQLLYLHLHIY